MTAKPKEQQLLDSLVAAKTYEEWYTAAAALDNLDDKYNWRVNPIDDLYDYRLLEDRRKELAQLRHEGNVAALASTLRQGLLRNHLNITRLPLYEKAYSGTKENILQYVQESVKAIRYVANSETSPVSGSSLLTAQERLDVLYESRKSFGCTALVLQGGSIFGLCHLGVVKTLFQHGLLPKVIVGTATGALMAALIGIHTMEELPDFLQGESLDLAVFAAASARAQEKTEAELKILDAPPTPGKVHNWMETMERRAWRLIEEGFLLDPQTLEAAIEANVGDITFREAFERTERVLNIIISSPDEEIPTLMNYLTAPDVLIRSAAMASHVTNLARLPKSGLKLLYKEADGSLRQVEFRHDQSTTRRPPISTDARRTPLARMRQQFNIDHFIISQARPYVAPFLQPSLPYLRNKPTGLAAWRPTRWFGLPSFGGVIKQGLLLTDIMGWLPDTLRRVLSDELIPGDSITLVPEFSFSDYMRLLKNPTSEEVNYWIMRGERSVWPSLAALKVRCMIEMALDLAYERVKSPRQGEDPFLLLFKQLQSRPPPLRRSPAARGTNGGANELAGQDDAAPEPIIGGELMESDDEGTIGGDDVGVER